MKKFTFVIVLCVILSFPASMSTGSFRYEKGWTTELGSDLNVEITPDSASFEPGKVYSFTVTLTAVQFGTNVDRLHTIYISLRFLNSYNTFYDSDYSSLFDRALTSYELPNVGAKVSIALALAVPNFSLDFGETISGDLQYKISFQEGVVWDFDTSLTTNWNIIASGSISENYSLLIIGGLGLFGIVAVVIIVLLVKRSRSRKLYPPTILQAQKIPTTQETVKTASKRFCSYCGAQIGSDVFCVQCGAKLQ